MPVDVLCVGVFFFSCHLREFSSYSLKHDYFLLMRIRNLPNIRESLSKDWFAVYRKICRQASQVD